jgi:hypothetical protein
MLRVGIGGMRCWINLVIEFNIKGVDVSHDQFKPNGKPRTQKGYGNGINNRDALPHATAKYRPKREAFHASDNRDAMADDALNVGYRSDVVGGNTSEEHRCYIPYAHESSRCDVDTGGDGDLVGA